MKKLRWVLVLGIVFGLALFASYISIREEPFFADTLPMLKGKPGTWGEPEELYDIDRSGLHLTGKSRNKTFILDTPYKAVHDQLAKELPQTRPLAVGSRELALAIFIDARGRFGDEHLTLRVEQISEGKTKVTVTQTDEVTWADRVSEWWAKLIRKNP